MSTPMSLTPTSHLVLGLLALLGPQTPYELKRVVSMSIGHFWAFPHSQLYAEPERLADAGLLEVDQEAGGRRRKRYAITDEGRNALRAWLADPAPERGEVRQPGLLKLFFGALADPDDMVSFAEPVREVVILDETGKPLLARDNARRFFEAAWLHTYNGVYYLSYSTGDTHFIVYATSASPYGPFTYRGKILEPVLGWTNHHSIVEFRGRWYLFYHDAQLSGGQTHLRNIKVTPLTHRPDGTIETIDAYRE